MAEDVVAVFIPIVFFVCVAAVLALRYKYRLKERMGVQATIREAIDKGQELTPELVRQLGDMRPENADLRRGMISIAVAAAVAIFAFTVGDSGAKSPLLGIAAFPLLIGVAYLILHRMKGPSGVATA